MSRLLQERQPSRQGRWWIIGAAALLCLGLVACDADDTQQGGRTITVDPQGDPPPLDNPGELSTTPALRRLSVDQLQATISIIAGDDLSGQPIEWRFGNYNAYDDRALGKVLGRPDYVQVTEEDTSPSSLYIKFAQDMSRSVCDTMIQVDLGRQPGEERTLWRFAPLDGSASDEQITANLQYLALRFLGVVLDADAKHVVGLRTLYQAGIDSVENPELSEFPPETEGWRAVCIALFEDPSFHLH